MSANWYKPEQIVNLHHKIEVEITNGKQAPQAGREMWVCEQTCYRWWKEFGRLKQNQMQNTKELGKGNSPL